MAKSPEAFRTISEVAEELDVPKHVLRFWEGRFNQLRPMKRGGGRRYYRPEDVDLLRGIRQLLYTDGYTIKGVQKILRESGPRFVMTCWRATGDVGADAVPDIPDVAAEAADSAGLSDPVPAGADIPEPTAELQVSAGEGAVLVAAPSDQLRVVISELEACLKVLHAAKD